jgi:hypothetical protein
VKMTAYEYTKRQLQAGWARASELDQTIGPSNAFRRVTTDTLNAARSGVRLPENESMITSLPFVMARRVANSVEDPFSWVEFATHPDIIDFSTLEAEVGGMVYKPDLALDWASASILNLWHYTAHEKAGERVYELSAGLAERLQRTELRGLSTDDLRLPFPSIYIVMPDGLGLKLENQVSGKHDLGGVYVTETVMDGVRHWKMLFWGPPNDAAKHEFDDALFHFTVRLPEDTDLEEALNLCEKYTSMTATQHSADYYRAFWRPLFKLVMNAVVYATWPDAELRHTENSRFTKLMEQLKKHPKGSHKRERVALELKEVPQQRRVVLGPSVRPMEHDAQAAGLSGQWRTLVTGHWKRQVHGEGRALRKWIFISPFWRGPDEAVESNPRRVLGT